jgi:hypothetical protein
MKQQVLFSIALTFATALSYSQSGRVGIGESSPAVKAPLKETFLWEAHFHLKLLRPMAQLLKAKPQLGQRALMPVQNYK